MIDPGQTARLVFWVANDGNAPITSVAIMMLMEDGKLAIMKTPNGENPLMHGAQPILGVDVWEHSYYLDFRNRRPDYLKAWWDVVNWHKVAENFSILAGLFPDRIDLALTHRIAYGVATGIYRPSEVLAVTFTTRAAGEMRTRLRDLGVREDRTHRTKHLVLFDFSLARAPGAAQR